MYNWLHSIEWQNVHNLEHFRHLYTSANALEKINNRFSIAGLPLWSWENAISKMYKNSHNSVEKKKRRTIKNEQRIYIDIFPKKTYKESTDTWKSLNKEIQMKTTMRYHLTHTHICWNGIIGKTENNKCWWGCGEKGTPVHCWWDYKLVPPLWKTVWKFLKK